jgi:hypothetical protein
LRCESFRRKGSEMRKLYLTVILISCLVMLSAAGRRCLHTTQASNGKRAGASRLANRPLKEGMGSDEQ